VRRTLFLVNVVVGGLGCLFAAGIVRDIVTHRSLPPVPAPRPAQSALDPAEPLAVPPPLASFQVIATRNMFNPARTEATGATAVAAMAAGVRPILHGVLIDGEKRRAFLEEPPARQVSGYSVGDQIAGGRLAAIEPDRVVIVRPQGRLEVFLQDASKPRPAAPITGGAAVGPQGQTIQAPSSSGRITAPSSSGRVTAPLPPQQPQ